MNLRNAFRTSFLLFALAIAWSACRKLPVVKSSAPGKPVLPSSLYEYMTVLTPNGAEDIRSMFSTSGGFGTFPTFGSFKGNEDMNNSTVTLGRVLFYDKRLSINNTIACASCHRQELGFSDGQSFSTGFGGLKTGRNSMAIITPLAMNSLFWDSRANSALDLSLRPVFNHVEMGMETDAMLEEKLSKEDFYPALFQNAYGSTAVTRERISKAISDFLNAMVTLNSKFDQGNTDNFAQFSSLEKLGKDLFFSERLNCTSCHSGRNFSAPDNPGGAYSAPEVKGTANIGLDFTYSDNGKGSGKFRIPSLRNIELTAPYMHDGRFATLEEVLEHYSSGIKAHPELDANLKENGLPKRMNLSDLEKMAVIAFLKTLTDKSFITDPRFSNPFKN